MINAHYILFKNSKNSQLSELSLILVVIPLCYGFFEVSSSLSHSVLCIYSFILCATPLNSLTFSTRVLTKYVPFFLNV